VYAAMTFVGSLLLTKPEVNGPQVLILIKIMLRYNYYIYE
jgi:hypothetical protein